MITANDARISELDDSIQYINLHTYIYTRMAMANSVARISIYYNS